MQFVICGHLSTEERPDMEDSGCYEFAVTMVPLYLPAYQEQASNSIGSMKNTFDVVDKVKWQKRSDGSLCCCCIARNERRIRSGRHVRRPDLLMRCLRAGVLICTAAPEP